RLRNYLNERLLLTEEGISLLVKSLKKLLHIAQNDSVTKIEAIATATIRLALNKQEVLERVKEQLHLEIRILSEDEEAYYGYLSVVNSMSIEEAITVDIGGGSTELTYFQQRQLIEKISLPFGALSLKE